MATVTVDVDLYEFDDEEILSEFKARKLHDQVCDDRDVRLLAEMIAAGESAEALSLLAGMFPGSFVPSSLSRIVAERQCGRLAL